MTLMPMDWFVGLLRNFSVKPTKNGESNSNKTIRAGSFSLLQGAQNCKLFKFQEKSNIQSQINKINASLLDKEQRAFNLILLLSILPQCDSKLIIENGDKWFRLCSQLLNNNIRTTERICLLNILTFLLRQSKSIPSLKIKISTIDRTILKNLYTPFENELLAIASLECLYEFSIHFPGEVYKHKNAIQQHIYSFLMCPLGTNSSKVKWAARVYWALPTPKNTGACENVERGKQVSSMISLIHKALDHLFRGVKEDQNYDSVGDDSILLYDFLNGDKDPLTLKMTANLVASNALTMICEVFFWSSSQFITISPKTLLSVIFRILQVELNMVRKMKSQEMKSLTLMLPSLHLRALDQLKDLLESQICLLFYCPIIEQLMAVLKSSNQSFMKNDEQINFQDLVRPMVYDTLAALVQVSGSCHNVPYELTKFLLSDIKVSTDFYAFQKAKCVEPKKSKKKGYSGTTDGSTKGKLESMTDIGTKIPLTSAALKLIDALFTHSVQTMHSKMVMEVGQQLLDCGQNVMSEVYSFANVRCLLYNCILSYSQHPHPLCLAPFEVVLHILNNGSIDSDLKVKEVCVKGKKTIAFISANPQVTKMADLLRISDMLEENQDLPQTNGSHETECSIPELLNGCMSENDIDSVHEVCSEIEEDDDEHEEESEIEEELNSNSEEELQTVLDNEKEPEDIICIGGEEVPSNIDNKNDDPVCVEELNNKKTKEIEQVLIYEEEQDSDIEQLEIVQQEEDSDIEQIEVENKDQNSKKNVLKKLATKTMISKRKKTPFKKPDLKKQKTEETELTVDEMMSALIESDSE